MYQIKILSNQTAESGGTITVKFISAVSTALINKGTVEITNISHFPINTGKHDTIWWVSEFNPNKSDLKGINKGLTKLCNILTNL